MELVAVPLALQGVADLVDAVGHHEHGAVLLLGEEVAQGAVEAAGEADPLAVAGDQGEGALDLEDVRRALPEQEGAGAVHRHVEDLLVLVRDEVENAGDGLVVHEGASLREDSIRAAGSPRSSRPRGDSRRRTRRPALLAGGGPG
jgi:hypothetical protein